MNISKNHGPGISCAGCWSRGQPCADCGQIDDSGHPADSVDVVAAKTAVVMALNMVGSAERISQGQRIKNLVESYKI